MKNLLFIFIVLISFYANAQVAVAKNSVDGAGLLDFRLGNDSGNDIYRGLILPNIDNNLAGGAVPGTIYYNSSNGKVEYLDKTSTVKPLSTVPTSAPGSITGPATDSGTGVLITDGTDPGQDTAPGVLVLSSSNKSLILPKVASPETNIINPHEGMIVYDTDSKSMAVFNGEKWSFWK